MAATVLTAAQSAATYQYSKASASTTTFTIKGSTSAGNSTTVMTLIGDASGKVSDINFTANAMGVIESGSVKINGYTYTWSATNATWTAA